MWRSGIGNKRRVFQRLALEPLESRVVLHGAGALSGFVYIDVNADGTRDEGEMGIPGVEIRLSASDSSDDLLRSTLTDNDGFYTFDELEPGTYQLSERQPQAMIDGQESTRISDAVSSNDLYTDVVLAHDELSGENNFGERGLRSEFISILWYLASTAPSPQMLRETIAVGEELGGNSALAESIRAGGDIPDDTNARPVASNDAFTASQNEVLTIDAASGVLANDVDPEGDSLTASLVVDPGRGSVTLNTDGSFTYTPDTDFSGTDSFTYQANDATVASNVATVTIVVNPLDDGGNQPFGPVTSGAFDSPELLGIRTDLEPGAPPITTDHVSTAVDYSGFSNPPTYGPHHGSARDAQNNSITPRPTGVYTTEQPDEDLVHNLEHGHVWISYNPNLISSTDLNALEQLVGVGGTDTGVILTPRSENGTAIALASWAHLLTLDSFDAAQIRAFVETNRGHSPEGFILSGQKPADGESLDDGLAHTP